MDVENGERINSSQGTRKGAARLEHALSLLDPKAVHDSIDPKELETDDYDGTVPVSDWLHQKRVEKRWARILQITIVVGLAMMTSIAIMFFRG
jgi:hypothetical protein